MLHSEPAKPHLPCSLRCCCLSAVSAYQLQLAVCADATSDPAKTRTDTSERNATDFVIGDYLHPLFARRMDPRRYY